MFGGSSRRRPVAVLALTVLWCSLSLGQDVEEAPAGRLWISVPGGIHQVTARGAARLAVLPAAGGGTLAVDLDRHRLWHLSSGGLLTAWDDAGSPSLAVEAAAAGGSLDAPAAVAVSPDDGVVWIGRGTLLVSFGFAGQGFVERALGAPTRASRAATW